MISRIPTAEKGAPMLNDYIELWLLADRSADTELRNSTINTLRDIVRGVKSDIIDWTTGFTLETTARIWSATTEGRALRRFVVDIFDSTDSTEAVYRFKDDWHLEFLSGLMVRRQRGEKNVVWDWNSESHYHEYDWW